MPLGISIQNSRSYGWFVDTVRFGHSVRRYLRWGNYAPIGSRGWPYFVRVLHVIASTDPRTGGPIEVVNSLSDVWERHGHTSHIVSLDKPDSRWLEGPGGSRTTALGPRLLVGKLPSRGYSFSPRLVPWLRRHASSYDAVILHGLWNYASYGGWLGLRGSGVPFYAFVHGMLDPWFVETRPTRGKLKSLFWKLFENHVVNDATGVLFTTDEERRGAARSFQPYRATECVVGLGVRDLVVEGSRAQCAFQAKVSGVVGRRYVLFLSRIHPKKGIDLLIRAFSMRAAQWPDLDLVIAGPDQIGLKPELVELAQQLGMEGRIHWPGMLSGDVKVGAFQSAEFFVLPSHQENFGIAIAEALACSTPVLITDKVNIWPQIAAENAGCVVSDDVEGIVDGLDALMMLAPDERRRTCVRARECFLKHFDLESISMALLRVVARERCHG